MMDSIISNEKLDLALSAFRKIAPLIAEHGKGSLPAVVPVVLIGGAALESYGIRESGEDIDLFVPGEVWGSLDLDESINELMKNDPIYQKLESSIENPFEQAVIEMAKDRDLYTEMDIADFESLVEPLETLTINGTQFEFKLPDLATIAFSKSNSFRDKDIRDVCLIAKAIGIERIMMEANRLIPVHGDDRVATFVRDGLSEISASLMQEIDYVQFLSEALSCLNLESSVLLDLYQSFGLDGNIAPQKDIWPSEDWEPETGPSLESNNTYDAKSDSYTY